jgi:hypothetical protein
MLRLVIDFNDFGKKFSLRSLISLKILYLLYWTNLFNLFPSILPFSREVFFLFNIMWIGGIAIHSHYRQRNSKRYQESLQNESSSTLSENQIVILGDMFLHIATCSVLYSSLGAFLSIIGWCLSGMIKWLFIFCFFAIIFLLSGFKFNILLRYKPFFKIYLNLKRYYRKIWKSYLGSLLVYMITFCFECFLLYLSTLYEICQNSYTKSAASRIGPVISRFIFGLVLNGTSSFNIGKTANDNNEQKTTSDIPLIDDECFDTFDETDDPYSEPNISCSEPNISLPDTHTDLSTLSKEERRALRKMRLDNVPQTVHIPTHTIPHSSILTPDLDRVFANAFGSSNSPFEALKELLQNTSL